MAAENMNISSGVIPEAVAYMSFVKNRQALKHRILNNISIIPLSLQI
jgi:hypothetical protein